MTSLSECQSIINRKFTELDLPECPANLYDPIRYMLDMEAKRLRPSLVLLGCNLFSDSIEPAIFPALAIEVFHNFTLMHDDIMDQSGVRRNKPTVHTKWNQNVAILSGDAMLIKAYELLSLGPAVHLQKILSVFNKTALKVCEGQQFDLDYENSNSVTIEDYIRMVEYKTAVLIAASLKIGSLVGGAGENESDELYAFGRNIGIAFQLLDDLLDVFADPEVFGKVSGNDIVSNKKTILLIEALNQAKGTARKELLDWVSMEEFDRNEKIWAVKSIYQDLGLEESVYAKIRQYHETAVEGLINLKIDTSRKSELLAFSNYLMNRKK
jgi:geranylgeranyl diphosphate synthase type II